MKERGIIFRDWEVRAILDGRKTMFRRAIKPQPAKLVWGPGGEPWDESTGETISPCPFGTVGDRLYVKETWMSVDTSFRQPAKFRDCTDLHGRSHTIVYRADANYSCDWRSPATMPRWASRITLEITNVRVERVQDITEQDAIAEGSQTPLDQLPKKLRSAVLTERCMFARIWNSIHGPDAWGRNDWVWAVTFKRLEGGAA